MHRLGGALRLLFMDECSFFGQPHVAAMSRRCQQVRGDHKHVFGDIHIVFVGDLKQHEPIGSAPLYSGAASERIPMPESKRINGRSTIDGQRSARRDAAAENAAGRDVFTRLDSVFILDEPQRQSNTPAGRTLRRFAELFLGNRQPTKREIRAWAIEYNSHAVRDLTPYLVHSPRVVTQRQLSRSAINLRLALAVAQATGRRACVWFAQHERDGSTVPDDVQRALRRYGNPENFDKLPAALVFFQVRQPRAQARDPLCTVFFKREAFTNTFATRRARGTCSRTPSPLALARCETLRVSDVRLICTLRSRPTT